MDKILLKLVLVVLLLTACVGDESRVPEMPTATNFQLPDTWTPQPSPTSPDTLPAIDTATPTLTPTTGEPKETVEVSTTPTADDSFLGADQWWLRFPQARLIGASQTNNGGVLVLVDNKQPGESAGPTILRLSASAQITSQLVLEGIKYPTGILETGDGGILVLEPGRLHKISSTGVPVWSRSYSYSEIGFAPYLFGPIARTRPAGEGTLVVGRYGDITTLDREGQVLDVDLSNRALFGGDQIRAGALPGASYKAEQESRTVYKLSRYSNGPYSWDLRFDFITFDVTLFAPHHVLGTRDGGALFLAPAPHLMGDGAFAIFAARVDKFGEVLWQQIYQGIYEGDFQAAELADGGFLIANTHTFFGRDYSGSFLRLTRLSSSGDLVWDRVYGNGETQIQVAYIFENPAEGFLAIGQYGFRGENDLDQGVALISVDPQGRIPGCRYLAEVPEAETLSEVVSTRFSTGTARSTRSGSVSAGESTEVQYSLLNLNIDLTVECAYPDPAFSSPEDHEDPLQRSHSFVDQDGFLIGGVQGDEWVAPSIMAAQLVGRIDYRLYNLTGYLGRTTGQLSGSAVKSRCPSQDHIILEENDIPAYRIALDGGWNAIPRLPAELSTTISAYRDVVKGWLEGIDLKDADITLDHVYQIDLDGDGSDEILLVANQNAGRITRVGVSRGDYSLIMLRFLQGNEVITRPLYERHITADNPTGTGRSVNILGFYDMNGDGKMEILTREESRQALRYQVFDFDRISLGPVLSSGCDYE